MSNPTYRHYRVARRTNANFYDAPPMARSKSHKKSMECCSALLIIPCILTLILGYCLGRYK